MSRQQNTAFLTGASSGIGKAAALSLTKAGYRVIGSSRTAKPGEICEAMVVADKAQSVADTIVRAATDKTPKLRYPSGKMAQQAAFARRFLPRGLFEKVLHKQFGLG